MGLPGDRLRGRRRRPHITLNRPDRSTPSPGRWAASSSTPSTRPTPTTTCAGHRHRRGRGFCAGADLGGGGATFDWRNVAATAAPPRCRRDGGGRSRCDLRPTNRSSPRSRARRSAWAFTMTLPMDVRIAAQGAKIGFVFARRGIVPEAASSWFCLRLVGISQAMEWWPPRRVHGPRRRSPAARAQRAPGRGGRRPARAPRARDRRQHGAGSVALAADDVDDARGRHPMAPTAPTRAGCCRGPVDDAREGVTSFLEKRRHSSPTASATACPTSSGARGARLRLKNGGRPLFFTRADRVHARSWARLDLQPAPAPGLQPSSRGARRSGRDEDLAGRRVLGEARGDVDVDAEVVAAQARGCRGAAGAQPALVARRIDRRTPSKIAAARAARPAGRRRRPSCRRHR